MSLIRDETLPIQSDQDIVIVRQRVRAWAIELNFGLVDQTKIVTAASELARNALTHGGGGLVRIQCPVEGSRKGLKLTFEDNGPGIVDLQLAMKDGYTTGGGLGLGLSGEKRLSNEFEIRSEPGKGTVVSITRWK
jgi:serine/threonine-protein kinase RsbT